jgi:hypothetical protein
MSNPSSIVVRDDRLMAKPGPAAGGSSSGWVLTPGETLQHLTTCEYANQSLGGTAYLRDQAGNKFALFGVR